MYGGVRGRTGLALVLGLGIFAAAAPANAADLGGDCCADLEERVAELEATTARKGNRKVSLEIYGQVNQSVIWWDDGAEQNAYVVTNDNSRTRFGFRGKAKIDSDWEAGYRLEIGVRTANSKRFTQNNDEGGDNPADVGFDMRDSYWYLKSKTYGAVSVGRQATATDAITEINQTQTADFSKYSDVEDTGLGLLVRSAVNGGLALGTGADGITWRRLIGDTGDQPGEGERRFDAVKYVSPTFAGFTASAAWGEDDYWDVAIRYEGEHAGFKISAGFGYGEVTDGPETQTGCAIGTPAPTSNQNCSQYGGSISIVHVDTGLFVNFGAGEKSNGLIAQSEFAGLNPDKNERFWAIQAGIEKKFIEHGKTTIYGEYYDYDGGANSRRDVVAASPLNPTGAGTWDIWDTGVQVYGGGIAQGFDKAATVLYFSYRHVEGDLTLRAKAGGAIADAPLEDLDLIQSGAIIKF